MVTNVNFSVSAALESVVLTRRRVTELAERAGMCAPALEDVRLCVTEAVANAVVHAYADGAGTVDVSVEVEEPQRELTVVVRDQGRGISPRRDELEPGYGLGIIRALSPGATITSTPGSGTEVRMPFDLDCSALGRRSSVASEPTS